MLDYINRLTQTEDELTSAVSAERLMAYTAAIAKFERVSGTKEEVESLKIAAQWLEGMGYQTRLTFHPACISVPKRAEVSLLAPERLSIEALTHSFAPSAQAEGRWRCPAARLTGRLSCATGLSTPRRSSSLSGRCGGGRVRQDAYLHNAPASALWGAPTEHTQDGLVTIPVVSVTKKDGDRLEAYVHQGAAVRLAAEVDTGWRDIPLLEADLAADGTESFVLFGGHIDSWHFGAMDNAAANATMLECAALLASRRAMWRRGLRLAFWAGHSQGRYAGSAWYADNHFEELQKRCAGYLYADSTGGMDADVITEAPVMPQTFSLAADVIRRQTGQEFVGRRIGRYADQSFYGVGIPSVFGTFSEQDAAKTAGTLSFRTAGPAARAGLAGGGTRKKTRSTRYRPSGLRATRKFIWPSRGGCWLIRCCPTTL
jgi:hypothetical protein